MPLSEKNISITLNDGENDIDTVKTGDILSSTKSYRRNADNLEFAVGEPNLSLYNDNLSTKVGIKSVTFNKDSVMKVDYKYSRSGKTLLELGLSTFDITFDNDYQLIINATLGNVSYLENVTSTFNSTQVTEEGQYQTVNFKYGSNDILGSVDVTVKADELRLTLQESLNLETGSTIKLIEKLTILDSAIYDESIPFEWVITGETGIITINEETDTMTAESSGTVKIHAVYNGIIFSNDCEVTVTPVVSAVFEFGEKDETQKDKESSTAISTYTETNNEYNLKLSNGIKMYDKSYDALGNAVLKLGTGSEVGSFDIIEIPGNIKTVVIYVSGRADSTANVSVNGVVYSLTTTSNSGSYTPIMVDSSINKTISFASLKTGADERCIIDRIEYFEEKLVKDKLVESISLSPSTLTLEAGATSEKLTVTFTPADATNKNIIWKSSDENVASVQDGVITAKEPSETKTVTITAESEDGGYIATCVVTVNAKVDEPDVTTYTWELTSIEDIKSTDKVVIVWTKGSTSWALSSSNGSSKAPAAVVVTVNGNKLISDVSEAITWNISNSNGTLTIYPNGTTSTWLYCNNDNNGVRVGTYANKAFTIDASSGYLKNTATNRYVGVYTTNPDVRCYTNTTGNTAGQTLGFYRYTDGSSGSEPVACEHTNTTTTTVDATCTKAGSTTITCDACSEIVSTTEIPMIAHVDVDTDKDHNCDVCGATDVTKHVYVEGVCNCGAEEETQEPETPVEKTATISFADISQRKSYSNSIQVWSNEGVTLTNNKASSTSNVGDYSNPARFYKSSEIIVETSGNIKSIVFECSGSYANALKNSITNGTVTVSGSKVTVILDGSSNTFKISSLSGGQVRMNSISVTYEE